MSQSQETVTAIQAGREIVTLINVFTVPPGGQEPFAAAQSGEYRRLRGQIAGSLSANLHRGTDGVTLANYAQFRSMDDYRAWLQSDLMRDHLKVIHALIQVSEPGMYRVVHVKSRRDDGVVFVTPNGPLVQIVRLDVDPEARATLISSLREAADALVEALSGVVSVSVLDGQPVGVEPPRDKPRGAVGDEKVRLSEPKVAAYIQLADRDAAVALAAHPLYRQHFTAEAPAVRGASSHLFETVFVQNNDPDKPAL
jgi:heme-degrading monooxygenase HmoA